MKPIDAHRRVDSKVTELLRVMDRKIYEVRPLPDYIGRGQNPKIEFYIVNCLFDELFHTNEHR